MREFHCDSLNHITVSEEFREKLRAIPETAVSKRAVLPLYRILMTAASIVLVAALSVTVYFLFGHQSVSPIAPASSVSAPSETASAVPDSTSFVTEGEPSRLPQPSYAEPTAPLSDRFEPTERMMPIGPAEPTEIIAPTEAASPTTSPTVKPTILPSVSPTIPPTEKPTPPTEKPTELTPPTEVPWTYPINICAFNNSIRRQYDSPDYVYCVIYDLNHHMIGDDRIDSPNRKVMIPDKSAEYVYYDVSQLGIAIKPGLYRYVFFEAPENGGGEIPYTMGYVEIK